MQEVSIRKSDSRIRCEWPKDDERMIAYHDTEWGVPLYDDQRLFEFIFLDAMQAGLSWAIVLRKREAFRLYFDAFDPKKIITYDEAKIEALCTNPEIIRNRLKIKASVRNARAFLDVQHEFGAFTSYIWRFVSNSQVQNSFALSSGIPTHTNESDAMSFDLKKRGFIFVGSTICYAFMQAAGLVNDHVVTCFRHAEVRTLESSSLAKHTEIK